MLIDGGSMPKFKKFVNRWWGNLQNSKVPRLVEIIRILNIALKYTIESKAECFLLVSHTTCKTTIKLFYHCS